MMSIERTLNRSEKNSPIGPVTLSSDGQGAFLSSADQTDPPSSSIPVPLLSKERGAVGQELARKVSNWDRQIDCGQGRRNLYRTEQWLRQRLRVKRVWMGGRVGKGGEGTSAGEGAAFIPSAFTK